MFVRACARAYVRACVRACVRASRWKILFTPYLVVELSPSAKIWCVYVTSISDGTQILTFLGINNNRDFGILDFYPCQMRLYFFTQQPRPKPVKFGS